MHLPTAQTTTFYGTRLVYRAEEDVEFSEILALTRMTSSELLQSSLSEKTAFVSKMYDKQGEILTYAYLWFSRIPEEEKLTFTNANDQWATR